MSEQERLVPMRLQRYLARAGAASRRGAENLMTAGRVRVNGEVVTQLGSKVDPATDVVTVDGVVVRPADKPTYIMLNKPAGYLTTMSDPRGRRCVAELVPTKEVPGLFPVGRLDGDTTGLLLFTTNGSAAQEMLHPSRHVSKHYVALVEGLPSEAELEVLRKGVVLDDGPTQPAGVELLGFHDPRVRPVSAGKVFGSDASVVGVRIHEGRKRQVKRMLAAIGHPVLRLHRDEFGPLRLTQCKRGSWRHLSEHEVSAIEALCSTRH